MKKSFLTMLLVLFAVMVSKADGVVSMRRPVDVNHPMFLVHIDTWNYPDPEKIIDLIPEDIKPFCVFNISLSISHNETTGEYNLVRNGIETAHSWARACAERGVWCMVQPASGGYCHFPDGNMEPFERFFKEYPNFLGFNYCEQFWGFNDKFSVTVLQRFAHFAKLMELSVKYGGYLTISWCGGIWHFNTDPLAMFKRNAQFKKICTEHPDNLIFCFKYTSAASWYNNESICLGTFIGGLTNNYGIRYDHCGWEALGQKYGVKYTDSKGEEKIRNAEYPTAIGVAPILENTQLTGMTVFDGPELIWQQCFRGLSDGTTSDGYKTRRWAHYTQFDNVTLDFYRKILDGTLRIPTRHEVMDKTQFVLFNNADTVPDGASVSATENAYATPNNLYDGLYKMDGEGSYDQNTTFLKKTGRYGAIPVVCVYNDMYAANIPIRATTKNYAATWNNVTKKVTEMNKYAPEEYTGDLYVGRMHNARVVYNPYIYKGVKTATVPFLYNTCEKMELKFNEFSSALVHEYEDSLTFYLNNYRVDTTTLKRDDIIIYGATSEPEVTVTDRSSHQKSNKLIKWENGVCTVAVAHNGPVDVTIKCSGDAKGRLSVADINNEGRGIELPKAPATYYGPYQHEAECFDYKNVGRMVTNPGYAADGWSMPGHYGQGYVELGSNTGAMVKDTIRVPMAGKYLVKVRYCAPNGEPKQVAMQVNGNVTRNWARLTLPQTQYGEWQYAEKEVTLKEGVNVIYLRNYSTYSSVMTNVFIDNIVIESLEKPLPGDANADGVVTVDDANMVVNYVLGFPVSGINIRNADVNGDGKVTMEDANIIVNLFLNK